MISLVESLINEATLRQDQAKDFNKTITNKMRKLFSSDKDFAKNKNEWYFNKDGDRLIIYCQQGAAISLYLTDTIVNELIKNGIKQLVSYKFQRDIKYGIRCKDCKGLTFTNDIARIANNINIYIETQVCKNFNVICVGDEVKHVGHVALNAEKGTKIQNAKIESFSMTFKADWFDGNSTIEIKTAGSGYLNWPDIRINNGGYDFLEEHDKTQIFNRQGRPTAKNIENDLPDFFELFNIKYLEDKKKTYWMRTNSEDSRSSKACWIEHKKPTKAKFIQQLANGWWIYSDDRK